MRVITFNANGIRSAASKGFFAWLAEQNADVVCIQETKAQEHQLSPEVYRPVGYHCHYHDAERKGYSGVALYARRQPDEVRTGLGWPECDHEGRWLEARFGPLSVVSLYLPSGSAKPERQQVKFDFMARLAEPLRAMRASSRDFILCGDWNIAHREIDLKNWRANRDHSGFLPEERAWLDELFGPLGWVDAFRAVNPNPDQYTWWSNRGRAWDKNVGWRIDYQVVTPGLAKQARAAAIYREQRFSDHAPLTLDYDYVF
ncbi:exodeoxyribonuclease III [Candidatus Competibacter phosphatis]|uniref:Exodeoxyribonuclease III n=1 Tax=Candidatus Competibacter phosphatis TaxID=221280 RepID=A0ABX1TJL3_9GAMM|nr:exodeoxyribonuclease III [Candidatus Competibacter phosphatis]NMQ18754.1 exodeoxyribonuclease III [Candidatus Competibacter phosphatis]